MDNESKALLYSIIRDLNKELEDLEKIHPYKVIGNPDTYSSYNEGWSDALDAVNSRISNISTRYL